MKSVSLALMCILTAGLAHSEELSGKPAPGCTLTSFAGAEPRDLLHFKGKVVYVDFWASWCGPCAQSFPYMNKLHREYQSKGLEIVGVNLDEEPQEAQAFLTKTPAQFTVLADASGACPQAYGVKAMPSSYLIDRQGIVRHVHLGFKPGEAEQLRGMVEKLPAEPAAKAGG